VAEETPQEQALKVNEAQQKLLEELRDDPAPRVFREGPLTLPPVAGIVVDEEDEPIAGAVVVLRETSSWMRGEFRGEYPRDPDIALCVTEEDGFFYFEETLTRNDELEFCVVAFPPGRGVASWHVPKGDRVLRNTLTVPKECSETFRVLDADGKPLQGAMVELVQVMSPELLAQIEETKSWGNLEDTAITSYDRCRFQPTVVTAEDGTFHIPHLPRDAGVILRVTHPDTCITPLRIHTGERVSSIGERTGDLEVEGKPNSWRLPRGRQVTVHVTCDDPQVSFRGAMVVCRDQAYPRPIPFYAADNNTFVVKHLASAKVQLVVTPPVDADYLVASVPLEFPDDQYTLERTVRLAPAKVVTGRVVDSRTGHGIPKVQLIPDIRRSRTPPAGPPTQVDYEPRPAETDKEGRFRQRVRPDAKETTILGPVKGYRTAYDRFDGVEDNSADISGTEISNILLKLDRTPRIRGIVQDHAGNPVAKGIIKGVIPIESFYFQGVFEATNPDGSFELDSVYAPIRTPSDTDKTVLEFWNSDRTQAKVLLFPVWNEDVGSEDQVVDVRLSPLTTANGRVVHALTGEAVPGIIVKLCRRGAVVTDDVVAEEAKSDPEGKFVLSQVIPGAEHVVLIEHQAKRERLTFIAQEGQRHDFGDTKIELRQASDR
jgi:hypothetical protein